MRQSNTYIIVFSVILTIVLGGLLSLAAVGLKPLQKIQEDLDTRKKILGAVMSADERENLSAKTDQEIIDMYNESISSIIINSNGEEVDAKNDKGQAIIAEDVNIGKEYKKSPEERHLPLFRLKSKNNPNQYDAYILPIYGSGLWDKIWGYVALEKDLETIKGIVFDHKGETPGLGARITSFEIQQRYIGKKIYDQGNLVSVTMIKGEKGEPLDDFHVDGMSGATLTGNGVNSMMKNYLDYYQSYFSKL